MIKIYTLVLLVGGLLLFWSGTHIMSVLGICTCIIVAYQFVQRSGKTIPIPELIALFAGIQWVLGAYIAYQSKATHYKYYMYVPEGEYMSITVPIYIAFCIGLLAFFRKNTCLNVNNLLEYFSNKTKLAYALVIIGIASSFIGSLLPASLAFVFFLAANLKYVGMLMFLFSNQKKKWLYLAGIMLLLFLTAIQGAMFHEFILWSIFIFLYVAIVLNFSTTIKITCIVIGAFFAVTLQSIKSDFRSVVWNDNSSNKMELFFNLIFNRIEDDSYFVDNTNVDNINTRFNQGWIISAIYEHVPEHEPYANGETIIDAIEAALVPRILNEGKKQAGGRENFMRFTGLPLAQNTSMGTSVLGEAYANFGFIGAGVFMFIWGIFLSFIFHKMISSNNLLNIVFIPLVFLNVVKAETEFVVVFNHLIKSGLFTFMVIWLIKKIYLFNGNTFLSEENGRIQQH